jgi:hypothetical protein
MEGVQVDPPVDRMHPSTGTRAWIFAGYSGKNHLMPPYDIYVQCTECNAEHPMRIRIFLDNGPDHKQSIAEFFQGAPVPPQVSAIRGHNSLCLKTGQVFVQENDNLVFLVPRPPSRYRSLFSS